MATRITRRIVRRIAATWTVLPIGLASRKFLAASVTTLTMLMTAKASEAVSFSLSSVGGGTWTYTLTYDPLDNYSRFQPSTTITFSGLSGVTDALGPTSPTSILQVVSLTRSIWHGLLPCSAGGQP